MKVIMRLKFIHRLGSSNQIKSRLRRLPFWVVVVSPLVQNKYIINTWTTFLQGKLEIDRLAGQLMGQY